MTTFRAVVEFAASLRDFPRTPHYLMALLVFGFVFHLLTWAFGANWWNDPAFLPTSVTDGGSR
jgi:hypothetical protein